ncbi:hypothetical protein MLD38_015057 [Melastoma candidum]|uniref:Uncharacterized protein n=1 Tax=Melastoma candidum TaxID=119954 RepID=A0ACB9RJ15_9MYRT|nr:hypothetical protein MLD38_015057 [Melastoma candidum]
MEIPMIDFGELRGENRNKTMSLLHAACENWGFFQARISAFSLYCESNLGLAMLTEEMTGHGLTFLQIENHGVDKSLMEKVKSLVKSHYEQNLKANFYESEIASQLVTGRNSKTDWETTFFISHQPNSNITEIPSLSKDLCTALEEYIAQLIMLAEQLSELMCENLGLDKDHIKKSFSGERGPSMGTKVAIYPQCPQPEQVRGLREHTDAGGIILLLQDDQVPGLEFLKDGKWVQIPPSKNNTIFINTGDQVEILSNGRYKSALHRVMAERNGSRLSIATFYNPASDAVISPAPKLLYPNQFTFGDYLKLYATTKFLEKEPRFETLKKMAGTVA